MGVDRSSDAGESKDDSLDDVLPSEDLVFALKLLSKVRFAPICPRCGVEPQRPNTQNGWCAPCDDERSRTLESKRRWWREKGAAQRRDKRAKSKKQETDSKDAA